MIGSHAGALALVPLSIHASRGAFFLFYKGLDNINFAVFRKGTLD